VAALFVILIGVYNLFDRENKSLDENERKKLYGTILEWTWDNQVKSLI